MDRLLAAPLFLLRLKPLLADKKLVFKPRKWRKTMEFMLEEGLHEEDVYDIVAKLKPEHYHQEPEPDDDGSGGDVMVFFYPYRRQAPPQDSILLYIKLKIWADIDGDAGVVMSFHDEGNI
ncbi:MAG: type II toxin-antitoxin system MqsR family toxin [Spirochaetaceae bacterium]|nr:type II toxin-antitoxin system MqsR family toxin [Spirochaetaceae bacterium]